MSAKQYRPWTPHATYLLPPSPHDWLSKDHLVFFVMDVVERLDLREIEGPMQDKDPRGNRPFHPRMMTGLLLYGYCTGVVSSRKLDKATYEDVATRVLTGDEHPDYTRISEFRRKHLKALQGLYGQVLRFCRDAGLVKLGHVSLDGTKVAANASKHKAMSHERMKKTEAELAAEVAKILQRAEEVDQAEDALYGKDLRGDELPAEWADRETRLARIRDGLAKLQAEAAATKARELDGRAIEAAANADPRADEKRAKAEEAAQHARTKAQAAGMDEPDLFARDPELLPSHQVQADKDGNPDPKAQRNFTDPDSRIMKRGNEYLQGYNCQAVVDEHSQVIVAQALTNQPPDPEHLIPMMLLVAMENGVLPQKLSADNGYYTDANAAWCAEWGVDAYISTGRVPHGATVLPPGHRETQGKTAMREKLSTETGRKTYSRRKVIVEPVFGQIKEARGLRRFHMRGLTKVRGEWSLICTTHNLLKLYRSARSQSEPDA